MLNKVTFIKLHTILLIVYISIYEHNNTINSKALFALESGFHRNSIGFYKAQSGYIEN